MAIKKQLLGQAQRHASDWVPVGAIDETVDQSESRLSSGLNIFSEMTRGVSTRETAVDVGDEFRKSLKCFVIAPFQKIA